jgi:hypothetical protein
MTKESSKPASAKKSESKPVRSGKKVALFAILPVIALAGSGYASWMYYQSAANAAHHDGPDPIAVSTVPTELAAETSFTHAYALSQIIANQCGRMDIRALKEASDAEARGDGVLVNMSWTKAARRVFLLDERQCRLFLREIRAANTKAVEQLKEKQKTS